MKYDLGNVIAPFWQDVIDRIKDNLVQRGHNASGNTLQSIEAPKFKVGDNTYNIQLVMPDHYAYLDQGVRGIKNKRRNTGMFQYRNKMPPIAAIRKFMINRGIVGKTVRGERHTKNSQKQLDGIAFAIARSIYEKGLEQTDFYSDVVNDQLINEFADVLLDELGREIIINIEI